MNNELETTWKEVLVAYFKELLSYASGKHEKPQSEQLVSGQRSEPGTSWIQRSANHLAMTSGAKFSHKDGALKGDKLCHAAKEYGVDMGIKLQSTYIELNAKKC